MMAEIAMVMAECNLNILAIEVQKQGGESSIYLEAEAFAKGVEAEEIFISLRKIPSVIDVAALRTLPQEKREKRFQVVLDSISDGILSVDEAGDLDIVNRVAREILDLQDKDVIGKNPRQLGLADSSILNCLGGQPYANVRRNVIRGGERFQFLATGVDIRDARGNIVGAVEVMRDMQGIRELASAVAQPAQVTFGDMIGQSAAIREAIFFAQKIALTEGIVSIRGESGTGKELFASAIHAESSRRGPFVPVNCAALPETLLESELFGYVGGAFSGAKREGKPGLFEIAGNGTIFLDEIAEMPLTLQAKMLRVIQHGMVRRIGGSKELPANARIITATNKNLEQMVEEGRFREDLYYRINVFPLHIPALRERVDDIPLLVEHFLFQINSRLGKTLQSLTRAALDKLCSHHWPGNVRELRNVIERAAILATGEQIDEHCILFSFEISRSITDGKLAPSIQLGKEALPILQDRYEQTLLKQALLQSRSVRAAARLLGISHTTLQYKMKKHNLNLDEN